MLRGRVLALDGARVQVRDASGECVWTDAGVARPGDWVEVSAKGDLRVLQAFAGQDFPLPSSETARLTARRMAGLRVRAQVLVEVRRYFSEAGFLEIEAPLLVPAPGLEVNIKALKASGGYLITSPEFSMKRLLVGGLERIYAIARCFREEEQGVHHSIEFSMIEWYRSFATLDAIMRDTEILVHRVVSSVSGSDSAMVGGLEVDVRPPWTVMTVQEAFAQWSSIELHGNETGEELAAKLVQAGIDVGGATEWDDLFYLAFVERVQPGLDALRKAVMLVDWPAPLAALARANPDAPQWALRFEAYVGGVELANAFDELTCPVEQRRRFVLEQEQRRSRGLEVYPIDEKFMAALHEGLPPCAGIALGLDRLAMLAAGADTLREVSAFVGDET